MNRLLLSIVNCGTLLEPEFGTITFSSGTIEGSVATYSCQAGYNIVGVSERTCQSDGTWSDQEPVCESKYQVSV